MSEFLGIFRKEVHFKNLRISVFDWKRVAASSNGGVQVSQLLLYEWGNDGGWDWQGDRCTRGGSLPSATDFQAAQPERLNKHHPQWQPIKLKPTAQLIIRNMSLLTFDLQGNVSIRLAMLLVQRSTSLWDWRQFHPAAIGAASTITICGWVTWPLWFRKKSRTPKHSIYWSVYAPKVTHGHQPLVVADRTRLLRNRYRNWVTVEELRVQSLLLHIERSHLKWLQHLFPTAPIQSGREQHASTAVEACSGLGWPGKREGMKYLRGMSVMWLIFWCRAACFGLST